MPLDRGTLEADIRSALTANRNSEDEESAMDTLVRRLATAIETYVKSGKVQVLVQGITTAGSPSAQAQVAPVPAIGEPMAGTGGIT